MMPTQSVDTARFVHPDPSAPNATTIELGRGRLSTALTALTDLDDAHLLTGVVGVVGAPRIETKTGRLAVTFVCSGEDKYLAAPLTDIIGRPVALVLYATNATDFDTFAADIIAPEETVTIGTARTLAARDRLAERRLLRSFDAYMADDDDDDFDDTGMEELDRDG